MYDASNRQSFQHIDAWREQVLQHHDCGPQTVKVLVGNKHDLPNVCVTLQEAEEKAAEMGALFFQVSAKSALNVDMAFLTSAQTLVEMRRSAATSARNEPKSVSLARGSGPATGPDAGARPGCGSCPGSF